MSMLTCKAVFPKGEVNALQHLFDCYDGLREKLFEPRKENYLQFTSSIARRKSKTL